MFPVALFHLCNSAERAQCCVTGFFRREATAYVLFGQQVEMRLHLLVELMVQTVRHEENAEALHPGA
jgi:hypothetical protein